MNVEINAKVALATGPIRDMLNRFRPRSARDMIARDGIISLFSAHVANRSHHGLLLHGPKGCGKTSAAMLMADVSSAVLVENASREHGPQQVQNIAQFASQIKKETGLRFCLIEDVDRLALDAQQALADHVRRCRKACSFIATSRDIGRVDQPLLTALRPVDLTLPKNGKKLKKKLAQRIDAELSRAGLSAASQFIKDNVNDCYPDVGWIVKNVVAQVNAEYELLQTGLATSCHRSAQGRPKPADCS